MSSPLSQTSGAGPPPKVGTFLITWRGVVSFFWASGWFLLLFLGMVSFELTNYDPLSLGAPAEPDGAGGLLPWRQGLARILLTVLRRAGEQPAAAEAETVAAKHAVSSQALLALRASFPDQYADVRLSRRTWRPFVVPNVGWLAPLSRALRTVLGDDDDSLELLSDGGQDRPKLVRRATGINMADLRMPAPCEMVVHIDAAAAQLGSRASGGFALKHAGGVDESAAAATAAAHRLLFESFVYCGNRRDTPSSIGRRIQEYFQSCGGEGGSAAPCVSPGVMAMLLLHRRIVTPSTAAASSARRADDAAPSRDNTRAVFVDLGAGSEIMSTIAVSALHGFRQSARLARTRAYHRASGDSDPAQQQQQQQQQQQKQSLDCGNSALAQAVIAPPALVVPVEMASEYSSPLEATKTCDTVPSNAKLFFAFNDHQMLRGGAWLAKRRRDCLGLDPDRVPTAPLSTAVGPDPTAWAPPESPAGGGDGALRDELLAAEPSTFYAMRTHLAKRNHPHAAFVAVSGRGDAFATSPRLFQCFVKEEVPQSSFVGHSDAAKSMQADARAAKDIRQAIAQPGGAASELLKHKRERLARLPATSTAWQHIADNDWYRRLSPHVDDFRTESEKRADDNAGGISSRGLYPSGRRRYAEEHLVKMHPMPLATILAQVESIGRGLREPELTGARATQHNSFVVFADVGGHDASYLDCGHAVSQSEVLETVVDATLKLWSEWTAQFGNSASRSSNAPIETVFALRPLAASTAPATSSAAESEFSGWCSACSSERARHIADATVAQLTRRGVHAAMISGCGGSGMAFVPLTADSSAAHTLRAFLLHAHGESADGGDTLASDAGASPHCTVWISSAAASTRQLEPTAEELDAIRMSVLDRLDDDAKAGLTTTERAAVTKGLAVSTSVDDADDGGNDTDRSGSSSAASSSWFSGRGILLLTVALLVAFFLIRGICRNFSFGKKKTKPKD